MAAVPIDGRGILLPILFPVIGIAGAPFTGTVATDLAVLGISCNFGAVIVGTTTMLAVNFATDGLAALELRRLKDLLAI